MLDLNGTREKCLSFSWFSLLLASCVCSLLFSYSVVKDRRPGPVFILATPRLETRGSNKNRPKGSRDSIVAPPLKSSKGNGGPKTAVEAEHAEKWIVPARKDSARAFLPVVFQYPACDPYPESGRRLAKALPGPNFPQNRGRTLPLKIVQD